MKNSEALPRNNLDNKRTDCPSFSWFVKVWISIGVAVFLPSITGIAFTFLFHALQKTKNRYMLLNFISNRLLPW